jgi:hypothetical protein
MSTLRREADGIWTAEAPQRFYGLHFGTRMTVLRLPDGGLWIHSPVSIDVALKGAIDALGPHGRVLESGGREAVRQAYRWLDGG